MCGDVANSSDLRAISDGLPFRAVVMLQNSCDLLHFPVGRYIWVFGEIGIFTSKYASMEFPSRVGSMVVLQNGPGIVALP